MEMLNDIYDDQRSVILLTNKCSVCYKKEWVKQVLGDMWVQNIMKMAREKKKQDTGEICRPPFLMDLQIQANFLSWTQNLLPVYAVTMVTV